jgi:hypothetical protein
MPDRLNPSAPVVLSEQVYGVGDGLSEDRDRHALLGLVAGSNVNHSVLDAIFRHFPHEELATHTLPPLRDSLSRSVKLTCVNPDVHTPYFPQLSRNELLTTGAAA